MRKFLAVLFLLLLVRFLGHVEFRRDRLQLVERHLFFLEILLEQLDHVAHAQLVRHVDQQLIRRNFVSLRLLGRANVVVLEQLR